MKECGAKRRPNSASLERTKCNESRTVFVKRLEKEVMSPITTKPSPRTAGLALKTRLRRANLTPGLVIPVITISRD